MMGEQVSSTEATVPLHRQLGLTDEEYQRIVSLLGREPNQAELAMYSVMWSEHCSYKSSKVHLRQLPSDGPRVLQGPGENAGVVDIGDGLAAVFKIESHNHPSFVEPFQGAATGVGGIIRDILAMGARPLASLNSLRFGDLAEPLQRRLLAGVVAGIGHYGNCVGVATVGGEVAFDPCYGGNPLVNALTLGVMPASRLLRGRAEQPGDLAELLGGLQDLGAAGISCAVSEVAARAGMGIEVDLDAAPLREPSMEPWEILISESQERMLALVHPGKLDEVRAVCRRWGVLATVIGTMVEGGTLTVRSGGEVVAEVPARSLADEGPVYQRPMAERNKATQVEGAEADSDPGRDGTLDGTAELPPDADADPATALLALAADPTCASKRWVYEQYDRFVGHGTVAGPGSSAAVIRVPGSRRAVALATDGNGRYTSLDPAAGAALAVAEAARNVACTGATPIAVTNCLNFASPERPEVMGDFAAAVAGLASACRALGTPVTGGNVSFYNESGGRPIHPTPVVGVLGLLEDAALAVATGFPAAGLDLWLLGETRAEFGGSAWQRLAGKLEGQPPALDLEAEAALQRLLVDLATQRLAASAQDLSEGGLAVALVEAVLARGVGATVELPLFEKPLVLLVSESASRALVSAVPDRRSELAAAAATAGVPVSRIGVSGGERLTIPAVLDFSLTELRGAYEGALERALGSS